MALASIECEECYNASYFKRVIEERFYNENETYFRIVYLWAGKVSLIANKAESRKVRKDGRCCPYF